MGRLLFSGVSSLVLVLSSLAIADSTTIPLDQIWAYQMPGTCKIEELDNVPRKIPGNGLLGTIFKSQVLRDDKLRFKDMARPGFAVAGSGRAALKAAHDVFVENKKPDETFSPDEEVTIVFFSEPVSRYRVEIQQVKRNENEIEIRYETQGSLSGGDFENLALIPLSKLPAGKYHVESLQLPRERSDTETKFGLKPLDEAWSRNWLCQPFSFTVASKHE